MPKECNHESTIDVGLVPHCSNPLSLDDVSGDSIRAVAHALILCARQAQSIDAVIEGTTIERPAAEMGLGLAQAAPC